MKNLKVSQKLIYSFTIVILITLVIGVIGIVSMNNLANADEEMYLNNAKPMGEIAVLYDLLSTQRICAANMVIFLDSDPQFSADEEISLAEKEQGFEESLARYEATLANDEDREIFAKIEQLYFNDFADRKQAVKDAVALGDELAMDLAIKEVDTMGSDISSLFDEANSLNNELAADKVEANQLLSGSSTLLLIIAMIAAVGFSVLLGVYLTAQISKPLIPLTEFMQQAGSTGNLTLSQEVSGAIEKYGRNQDEIGRTLAAASAFVSRVTEASRMLLRVANGDISGNVVPTSEQDTMGSALKYMLDLNNSVFSNIMDASTQVSTDAQQISNSSQSLAQGATEQTATIEELSGSLVEITEKTRINADMADQAAKLADTIKGNAENGSRQMDEMITAVKEINSSSQNISKVIKVIDDIAFQTNILALNAAVEAARAGQHGKGFAVVADEVRNLASKSAEAAKNTGSMIQDSIEKAEFGSRIAGETAESLGAIISGINESNRLISEIARLSEEQSKDITQLDSGIDQVAQVVQQNSATAQENAAASHQLSSSSNLLLEMIGKFELRKEGRKTQTAPSLTVVSGGGQSSGFALTDGQGKY